MTAPLAARGYRLIAPSRAGYLRSSVPPRFTVDEQAAEYAALLAHLRIRRAAVVGISAGAWSALAFARQYPDRCRALVLIVPAGYLPPGQKNNGGWVARVMFRSSFVTSLAVKMTSLSVISGPFSELMLGTKRTPVGRRLHEHIKICLYKSWLISLLCSGPLAIHPACVCFCSCARRS